MKNLFLLTCLLEMFLSSCNHKDKALKDNLINPDSVAINYFTGDGKADTVTAVKIIRDKMVIAQLTEQVTGKLVNVKTGCGYDGSIHYFRNDSVIQDIKFRMNAADCMLFTFVEDGTMTATFLSPEAKKLLQLINK